MYEPERNRWAKKIAKIFKEKSINRFHYETNITSEPFGRSSVKNSSNGLNFTNKNGRKTGTNGQNYTGDLPNFGSTGDSSRPKDKNTLAKAFYTS